jgi:hypothetical protein
MMKKSSIILLLVALFSVCGHAENMMHILRGGYDAQQLTAEELDSVLLGENGQVKTERYRLEYTNKEKLFRHSFFADYYLYDTQKRDTVWLTDVPVRDAVMSPNGKYVVYAKADNNLYIYKVDFKTEVAITTGDNAEVFNGISDWLRRGVWCDRIICLFAR